MKTPHEPVYRVLLKDALLLTWKHKFLWLFGLFLTITGQSGVYDVLLRSWNRWLGQGFSLMVGPANWPRLPATDLSAGTLPSGIILVALISIFIGAVFIFLGVVSMGGTIWTTKRTARRLKVNFRDGWARGLSVFWQLLLIAVVTYVLLNVLFVVIAWPTLLLATYSTATNVLIFLVAYLIFLPIALAVAFISLYAACGVVLHRQTVPQAVASAFHLVRKNVMLSVEMALALFIFSLVFSLLVLLAVLIVLFPFFLAAAIAYLAGSLMLTLILLGIAGAIFVVVTVLAGSFISAYQIVAWTLLYQTITERGVLPKLVRLLHRVLPSQT